MTQSQQPLSQRLVQSAIAIEQVFAQLEFIQAVAEAQMQATREISAELRNVAQSLAGQGD